MHREYDEEEARLFLELPLLLLMGGVGYYALEFFWRGRSHWSMAICGSLCFLFIYRLNEAYPHARLWFRALQSALFITATELFAGCILNLGFGLGIRNYSTLPAHLLGQICLPYSALWFLLSLPLCGLCRWIRKGVFLSDE